MAYFENNRKSEKYIKKEFMGVRLLRPIGLTLKLIEKEKLYWAFCAHSEIIVRVNNI